MLNEDMMDLIMSSWRSTNEYKCIFKNERVVLPMGVARLCEIVRKTNSSQSTPGQELHEYNIESKTSEFSALIAKMNLRKAKLVRPNIRL